MTTKRIVMRSDKRRQCAACQQLIELRETHIVYKDGERAVRYHVRCDHTALENDVPRTEKESQ